MDKKYVLRKKERKEEREGTIELAHKKRQPIIIKFSFV